MNSFLLLSLSLSLFFSREPVIIRSFVEVSRLSAQSVPGRLNFHETSDSNLITAKLSRAQKNRSIVERLIESRNSSRVARARRTRYMRIYIRFRLETGNRPTRLKMSARSLCPPSQLPDRTNRYADPPRRIRPRYTAKQEVFPPTGNKRGKFRRIWILCSSLTIFTGCCRSRQTAYHHAPDRCFVDAEIRMCTFSLLRFRASLVNRVKREGRGKGISSLGAGGERGRVPRDAGRAKARVDAKFKPAG